MAHTDTLRGAQNAFTFFYAYFNAVAEEIGMDRAIALDAHVNEMMGMAQGQAIKSQVGLEEIDLATASALANASIEEGMGIRSEVIEESAERIVSKCGRCPVYEGAQAVQMDNVTIEALCRATSLPYMDALVKQWNPNFSYRLREFRASAEGNCVEEIVIT